MVIKKDWLMFGIFIFFFIMVGTNLANSLIRIKNVLNKGITIRHMEAGKWEKEAAIYKDQILWKKNQ